MSISLHNKITTEIESLNKWMMANKLTLNLSKSNIILIQPKNLNNKVKFSFKTSNFVPEISTVNNSKYRYLGVLLDNSLTLEPHNKVLTNTLIIKSSWKIKST